MMKLYLNTTSPYARFVRVLLIETGLIKHTEPDYPVGLTSFPYVHYHSTFPYSVFLGPGGADFNVPQMYWRAIGTSVDSIYRTTYMHNRIYGRPIYPLGQVWMQPPRAEVLRFRSLGRIAIAVDRICRISSRP